MAANNGNGGPPSNASDLRDQYYVSYERSVKNIRNAATACITDLVSDGHPELTAPFARILEALAGVDSAALKALDEQYAEQHRNGQ